ncbi:Na+/H+ antiporter NhaD type [hydrothermal vent metagenome]|uniref:Na+/H+ antiporter NhaD type n=1 Tax=hydrothermal vent metagenome TaxID=652676 RepID=A0A1W1CJV7_9ZZZZ
MKILSILFVSLFSNIVIASDNGNVGLIDLTDHIVGYTVVAIFVISYAFVMLEEMIGLRKSKPVIFAAGLIWILIAIAFKQLGAEEQMIEASNTLRHNLLEYAELFLFLLVAMTYIEVLKERNVFEALKSWLVKQGFSLRQLFWITGFLAFFISPVADNLTTALIMGAVVLSVGGNNVKFISIAFINIVVAANAGGAFSPFGDITTLMVWQKGMANFGDFFALFIPSLVNFVVPAIVMNFFINKESLKSSDKNIAIKSGGIFATFLFAATIITAVSFHSFLHLPPAMGMMFGLSYLMFLSYYIKKTTHHDFDIFAKVARAEWDTLLFFFGIILSVGGLGYLGYLALVSETIYLQWGATYANVFVGILSAVVDNIPVIFAVLTMQPDMSLGQWLLVTLTAGVGGSLLSIGSAAGVALMGQSKGLYTFMSHLRWTPVIALGYFSSIGVHLLINAKLF